jgi:hypothetical protein
MTNEVFSPLEQKVLRAIESKDQISLNQVAKRCYRNKKAVPVNPGSVISVVVGRINRKCKYHNFKWFINGVGVGRNGRVLWKDKV